MHSVLWRHCPAYSNECPSWPYLLNFDTLQALQWISVLVLFLFPLVTLHVCLYWGHTRVYRTVLHWRHYLDHSVIFQLKVFMATLCISQSKPAPSCLGTVGMWERIRWGFVGMNWPRGGGCLGFAWQPSSIGGDLHSKFHFCGDYVICALRVGL